MEKQNFKIKNLKEVCDTNKFLSLSQDRESERLRGIPTHFKDLDSMVKGIGSTDLICIAGRSGIGKTSFLTNLAANVCFTSGKKILFFSMEKSSEQVFNQLISSEAEVEPGLILSGMLDGLEYQKIVSVASRMQKHMFLIEENCFLIEEIIEAIQGAKETYDIDAVFIDGLQLIADKNIFVVNENRYSFVGEVCRILKTLTKELSIPIVFTSQISRKVNERPGHRPMFQDLETKAIEEYCDALWFLHRREFYDPYDKPAYAELIIAKNRNANLGSVDLFYRKDINKFMDFVKDEPDFSKFPDIK